MSTACPTCGAVNPHACGCDAGKLVVCPSCDGRGHFDDDPEVPGSVVECIRCCGAGECSPVQAKRYLLGRGYFHRFNVI